MAMPYAYREEQEKSADSISSIAAKPTKRRTRTANVPVVKTEPVEIQPASIATLATAEALTKRTQHIERVTELEAKRDNLIDRLDVGAARIQEARSEGKDVTSWEDFWLQLLRSYEQVCDELRTLTDIA
jgi:hypothetical protein